VCKRTSKITTEKQEVAAVLLDNFAAIENLSMQIQESCDYKTSLYAKSYPFVSGFAITLRGGDE
jgi:hypothetical protein